MLAAVLLLGTAAACGGDSGGDGDTDEPFKVLFVSGQTGLLSVPATGVTRGLEAFVEWKNEQGGVKGRPIELEIKDNQSDPTRGVTLIQEEINSDDPPDLVVTGISSNEALAAAPILMRAEVLTMQSAASPLLDDVDKYPYFFSTALTHEVIYESMLNFIKEENPDVDRVALVAPQDAIGDATQEFFDGAFKDSGIETSEHRFKGDDVDISPVFQDALSKDPDFIIMEGAGAQVATMVASRVKAGAESVPTIIGSSASSQPILEIANEAQRENLFNTLAPGEAWIEPEDRGEIFGTFVDLIKAQGELESPISVYQSGWDVLYVWTRAVESIDGEITSAAVREALENLPDYEEPLMPAYGGGGGYSAESHFHPGKADDFTFGRIIETRDGMSVLED